MLSAAGCGAGQRGGAHEADLVLVGGTVVTLDPAAPTATAIAIDDGRIVAVGDDASVRAWIGDATRVIDLHGRGVTPGLVDAHCHLYGLGKSLEEIALRGATSEADAARLAAEGATRLAAGEWAVGRGWDQNTWPGQAFPTAAVLDRALGERPAALRRVDGHALWVTSATLRLASIDERTVDPPGGRIVRDDRGRPTGVLIDNAMALVDDQIPAPSDAVRERRIRAAAAVAIAHGITAVHEMGIDDATAGVYRELADEGRLPLRVYGFLDGSPALAETLARRVADQDRSGDAMFVLRGVKFFADGALGSRGARLHAPYRDDPGTGLWLTEPPALSRAVEAATAAGWQVAVHAIGDAGVSATLDAFEAARTSGRGAPRFRVEHAQVVAPADFARLARIGAIASMQPTHATSDMPWAEARLGPERMAGAYAWRKILTAGVPLAFGSDFPVEAVAPLGGIAAAVTRQDAAGQPPGGFYPGERLTLEEALAAFTTGGARAAFAEDQRGRIKPGMVADLTIFDRALAAASLPETRVDLTVVGGLVVFERK